MIQVSLFIAPELSVLLEGLATDFVAALISSLKSNVSVHVEQNALKYSTSFGVNFQVRIQGYADTWFVGAICIKKVFEGYFAAFATGHFEKGTSKDHAVMARIAQDIYTRVYPQIIQTLDELLYSTPSGDVEDRAWTYLISDKPI